MAELRLDSQASAARRMYDSRATNYEESWHPAFAKSMVELLNLQPGEYVLDLACGTGLVAFDAAAKVGPTGFVLGVDVSEGMLAKANVRLEQERDACPQLKFICRDITVLQTLKIIKEGTFDVITCVSALVLLRDPRAALMQWIKYLKPGGRLLTDVPHPRSLLSSSVFERVHQRLGTEPPSYRWWVKSEESLKIMIGTSGFDLEKSRFLFAEQAGYGSRYRCVRDADDQFEQGILEEHSAHLRVEGVREEAKNLFRTEWTKMADLEGKLIEIDGSWVTIAVKPAKLLSSDTVVQGSCACGSIAWKARCASMSMSFCYCEVCRKISGGPFLAFMDFHKSNFTISSILPSLLKTLEVSPYAERQFCGNCSSTLTMVYHVEPDNVYVAVGTMDESKSHVGILNGLKKQHIFVKDVPSWYSIPDDGEPRYHTMKSAERLLPFG